MKYEIQDEQKSMVSEAPFTSQVRARCSTPYMVMTEESEDIFSSVDAPCQFSIDEVKLMLKQNIEDYNKGVFYTEDQIENTMNLWG